MVSFYEMYGYIRGVKKQQHLLENRIETANSENRSDHITGFEIRFYLMI